MATEAEMTVAATAEEEAATIAVVVRVAVEVAAAGDNAFDRRVWSNSSGPPPTCDT